jgi:hypothetical protein
VLSGHWLYCYIPVPLVLSTYSRTLQGSQGYCEVLTAYWALWTGASSTGGRTRSIPSPGLTFMTSPLIHLYQCSQPMIYFDWLDMLMLLMSLTQDTSLRLWLCLYLGWWHHRIQVKIVSHRCYQFNRGSIRGCCECC